MFTDDMIDEGIFTDDVIEKLKIDVHLSKQIHSRYPSFHLDDLDIDIHEYSQILFYHILVHLLKYEGEIPKIKFDEKGKDKIADTVNLNLDPPRIVKSSNFYDTVEELVENYNSTQQKKIRTIRWRDYPPTTDVKPLLSRFILKDIFYSSIGPFLSEDQIKTTIEQKFDFIVRFIIKNKVENLLYQYKKEELLCVHRCDATKSAKVFVKKLTDGQKQSFLKFENYLKNYLEKGSDSDPYPWSDQEQGEALETLVSYSKILPLLIAFTKNPSSEILAELKKIVCLESDPLLAHEEAYKAGIIKREATDSLPEESSPKKDTVSYFTLRK
ncbi:MAG: hypothetical protein RLY40_1292 [Pseudomonadota bacterium]|jgi:hypothetical protein